MIRVKRIFYTTNLSALLLAFTVLVLLCTVTVRTASAQAQYSTIEGRVVEEGTNRPLIGTNVVLLNTSLGASTDVDGNYTILRVPPGTYTLEVSFIGYATQNREVTTVANQVTTADFEMAIDILRMDEIVVTGTGSAIRKKELTTSIQTITPAEIEASPAVNIQELLQGRLQGGQVKAIGGQYGQGDHMRLRGFKSFSADQTPVIYIDGVRVENRSQLGMAVGTTGSSALADIHVENIDRIEVTKGGAASTLYGSEAAAGVIQIFTKAGVPGKAKWRFNIDQGWDKADDRYIRTGMDPDHLIRDLEFRTAQFQKYHIGVSGGTELATYDVSLSLEDNSGVYHKTGSRYYGLNSSLRMFPTEKLQINIQTRASRDRYDRTWSSTGYNSAIVAVLLGDPPFKGDPSFSYQDKVDEVKLYQLPDAHDITYRYGFGITGTYDYNQYINTALTLGLDYRKAEQRYFEPIEFGEGLVKSRRGTLQREDREFMTLTFDYRGTLKYPQEGNLTSAFTTGVQGFRRNTRVVTATGSDFGLPGTRDFDNAGRISAGEDNQEVFNGGLLFNEQIGFLDKLFLTLGYRIDGNTAFGRKGKKSGIETAGYPKVAIAYNVSDEAFWEDIPFSEQLNTLKLRAAYGETGSFPGVYTRDKTFTQGTFRGGAAGQFGNPGNPDIKPERTATTEFGVDLALFNGRIGLDISHYYDKTTDALLLVPSDPSGAQAPVQSNVGEIENKGWDISGDLNLWNSQKVRVDLTGGFTTIDNEVVSLGGVPGFELDWMNRIEEGQPMGILEVPIPVPDANGQYTPNRDEREIFKYINLQPFADKIINLGLKVAIGNNFTLQMYGDGQFGGHTFNITRLFRMEGEGGVILPDYESGDHMVFNGGLVPDGYFPEEEAMAAFFEKSDYFKIRELSATYRIPRKIYGADVAVNFSARNFWNVYVPNNTIDPELDSAGLSSGVGAPNVNLGINSGVEGEFSPPIQYRFGLRISL